MIEIFGQIESFIVAHPAIVAIATIAVPVVTVIALLISLLHQTKQTNKIAKRDNYLQLELASIDLFKFEMEQSIKTWRLYNDKHVITKPQQDEKETQEIREMTNHVTQILNIFEMSIELHRKNVFDDKIFSTWIKWIHEFAQLENFQKLWKNELNQHYTQELYCLIKLAEKTDYKKFIESLCKKNGDKCYQKQKLVVLNKYRIFGINIFASMFLKLINPKKYGHLNAHKYKKCHIVLRRYHKLGKHLKRFYNYNNNCDEYN